VIITEFLDSLKKLEDPGGDVLSITEASRHSGYSADHLRREITAGRITNSGRPGKPAVKRSDLPIKPGHSLGAPSSDGAVP
jgi:hypothetical protein